MTIAKALPDGKNVVAVDVTLGGMQDIIKDDFDGDSNDSRMVISSNGFVVAHTDDKERGRNYVEEKGTFGNIVFNKAIEAAGDYVTVSNKGHTYTIYDVPIGNGWTSISVIDSRDEYIPIIVLNTISFTAIVLTFVIFFVMMINMSRSTLQSKAKSTFLSNMSHEIRTPINTILGMNEVILRESKDDNIVGYARNINSSGHTLLGIINDILDFSKIESGKLEIMPSDYDLAVVLSELVNMIKPRLDDKRLKLVLDIDRNIPRLLRGDDVRLKQVAANILTNAVKYTDRGEITLKWTVRKKTEKIILLLLQFP
jgi:signal transduction histidine kinase